VERILISERPFSLAAARSPFAALPTPAHARVGQPAVPGTGYQGTSGSVVSQNQVVTHNYMTDAKQATWLRATKARGVPPRGWPV
jgi:hypothetical protein